MNFFIPLPEIFSKDFIKVVASKKNIDGIWYYFGCLLKIPRGSGKEKQVSDFVKKFAQGHSLPLKVDNAGNILVVRPSSKGCESYKPILLQAHLDMSCEKEESISFDFSKQEITLASSDEIIKAKGTTLGADNGIGVALMLTLLGDSSLRIGKVGCLFTVEEEVGLVGVKKMDRSLLTGFEALINLDSQEFGTIFTGCAGSIGTNADFIYQKTKVPENYVFKEIFVDGLLGGHSGSDIHLKRANAILILNRLLWLFQKKIDFCLCSFNGGTLRNAIPRFAKAVVAFDKKYEESFDKIFKFYCVDVKDRYALTDKDLKISCKETSKVTFAVDSLSRRNLICTLRGLPNGVIQWSSILRDVVETSTTVCVVKFLQNSKIQVVTTQRSLSELEKNMIAEKVENIFTMGQAQVVHNNYYPGWMPEKGSEMLKIAKYTFKRLFGISPKVSSIHAGLECGVLKNKKMDLDMISLGPTIKNAHSPNEALERVTVEKLWTLVLAILKELK